MPRPKPTKRAGHIRARSITLVDSQGRPRIWLDAGGRDGLASICLFANDGANVQISAQPDHAVSIQVFGRECQSHIVIGISGDDRGLMMISDHNGKLGTVLGEEPGTSTHRLMLFKDGQHYWQTPSGGDVANAKKTVAASRKLKKTRPR